ncbi:MAG: pyridoxal phosphate-dependent aminotransferase [Coriobacteriales bacterium]|jgi:aspartate aminotransferase
MINEEIRALGAAPNKIRETFAYGEARKKEIGEDKVFDLSIGNPSVPSPAIVDETIEKMARESHGRNHAYTQSPGLIEVRNVIADNLNRRFGTDYTGENLYLTSGASSSIAITLKALVQPGEQVICVAPYFMEYKTWTHDAGGDLVEVPARESDFQMDVPAMEAAITEKTAVVIINTPNNPVGAIYSRENLEDLAEVLRRKSAEYGHPIYLLSDEPYRELYYEDQDKPSWVPDLYENTLIAYSWSKSLSLPGERIAYILVPSQVEAWRNVYDAIVGAGRLLGYICAGNFFQRVVAACIDAPVDKEAYAINRKIFMEGLDKIGYTYIKPQGAFYMWIKALEPDANAFYERAKAHELLLVPSDGFGMKGWVRAGYCCSKETIEGALGAFQELWDEYHAE